jgi:hypothetical protein
LLVVLASEDRLFLQMVTCPEAAHICVTPRIHSSLPGHRNPATPGRRLKCAMIALGLVEIAKCLSEEFLNHMNHL